MSNKDSNKTPATPSTAEKRVSPSWQRLLSYRTRTLWIIGILLCISAVVLFFIGLLLLAFVREALFVNHDGNLLFTIVFSVLGVVMVVRSLQMGRDLRTLFQYLVERRKS